MGRALSGGTRSFSDLVIASTTAASSARLASSSVSWDATAAAAASFFEVFLLRLRGRDDERCLPGHR
jgi:hypothetical protein